MECMVELAEVDYSFLRYDSYLDCYECYGGLNVSATHTTSHGSLRFQDLELMRAATAASMSIIQVLQARILNAIDDCLDNHEEA